MRCIVVFVTITLTVVQATSVQDIQKCMDLKQSSTWHCCIPETSKRSTSNLGDYEAILKECIKLPIDNCERDKCFGVKKGYTDSDGKFDKKATQEKFIEQFSSVLKSETMDMIANNCINGDLTLFGSRDMCDLTKFALCVNLHLLITCSRWNTDDSCKDIKNLADECAKLLA